MDLDRLQAAGELECAPRPVGGLEQAVLLPAGAPPLAREADAHVFGPRPPQEDAAAAYWTAVEAERRSMSSGVSRARRWLAAVNLKTFFHR